MRWSLLGAFALTTCACADNDTWLASPRGVSNLHSYCQAQLASFTQTYQSTQIATSRVTWYEGYGLTDSKGIVTGPVTAQSYGTSTYLYTQYAFRAYTPKEPCCSSCYVTAGTIDFYFWPDQATPTAPTAGQATTSVNAEGFTFTSPSVYMAFSSLAANNACGAVGDVWTNTTIAFHPTEITTVQPVTTLTVLSTPVAATSTTYNYIITALTTQPPPRRINYNDIGQNCSAIPGYVYWPDNPMNADNANFVHDPCHPVIRLPRRLLTMQPAWSESRCGMKPGTSGAYDPPRVLTRLVGATEVAVPTPEWEKTTTATQTASPASSATVGVASTTLPVTSGVSAAYDINGDATDETDASTEEGSQGNEAGSAVSIQSDKTTAQQSWSERTQAQQTQAQQTQAQQTQVQQTQAQQTQAQQNEAQQTQAQQAQSEQSQSEPAGSQSTQQQGSTQGSGAASPPASTAQDTGLAAAIMSGLGSGSDSDTNTDSASTPTARGTSGSDNSGTNTAATRNSAESQKTGSTASSSRSKATTRASVSSDGGATASSAAASASKEGFGSRTSVDSRMEFVLLMVGIFGIWLL